MELFIFLCQFFKFAFVEIYPFYLNCPCRHGFCFVFLISLRKKNALTVPDGDRSGE